MYKEIIHSENVKFSHKKKCLTKSNTDHINETAEIIKVNNQLQNVTMEIEKFS